MVEKIKKGNRDRQQKAIPDRKGTHTQQRTKNKNNTYTMQLEQLINFDFPKSPSYIGNRTPTAQI